MQDDVKERLTVSTGAALSSGAPAPCALRFQSVAKKYDSKIVLDQVTFEIRPGEFFGLVGVNGAGKTTLLKCLLDFAEPDTGSIEIFGRPHRAAGARSQLAFLPERFMPPYFLRGDEFIKYVMDLQSTPYDRAEVEHVVSALDLDLAALSMPVRTYSKGMTQKLGLAACFLGRKALYVLDEPTSGLDPKARALLKSYLRSLAEQARTVFFTSHALADVGEICDRMAVLSAGRIVFAGTPQALCAEYGARDLEAAFLACIGHADGPDSSSSLL